MKRIHFAKRRRLVGLSQEKLAEQLGVDRTTVIRWERGETEPQPWQRPNLAMALKVSVEELARLLGDVDDVRPGDNEHLGYVSRDMKHKQISNPGLEVLIRGAGFSLERFAEALNHRGPQMHGESTSYDRITVERWLAGAPSQNSDVVAAVLTDAWGIPIPAEVIWPDEREGKPSPPAHLQPWAAARTLEELGFFLRRDMLTRRETLAGAVKAVSGPALLAPIAGWLSASPGRLKPSDHGTQRIGASDVELIERSTRYFAATDAEIGGALSREAAVGQLKYAVDLARDAIFSEATGNRLLAVIAELSGLVGYMCYDSGMEGPAQRYFTYGLQAARESADPRAPFLVASILTDMAEHIRYLDRPDTALHLHDLAINQLPPDRDQLGALHALLCAKRAGNGLAHLGPSRLPEMRSELSRSFDLYGHASDGDQVMEGVWHRAIDLSEAELAVPAAVAYTVLARTDPRLVDEAEKYTLVQLEKVPEGQGRSKLFAQIRLATIRFLAGEAEQACDDGDQALHMAQRMTSSRIKVRLCELLADSEPYVDVPRVVEFRDRLRGTIARLN